MDAGPHVRGVVPAAPARKARPLLLIALLSLAVTAALGWLSPPPQPARADDRAGGDAPAPAGLPVAAPSTAPATRPAEADRATIKLLYVDGYPRWEYRYLKNEMIRSKSVEVSCLLTSAAADVVQEGDPANPRTGFPGRIKEFPDTLDELLKYDVVVFGDVDPREFTDGQLKAVADFVTLHGGGFGMVAGPRFSPAAYRETPVAAVLPVDITRVPAEDPGAADAFRPALTTAGLASPIFRGLRDADPQRSGVREDVQPLYWYCRGVTAKAAGAATVLAAHPVNKGPDGAAAPIIVVGSSGKGRTMFAGIDDTWRWRFYTGEDLFNTYWMEHVRALAAGREGNVPADDGDGASKRPAGKSE